MGKEIIKIKNRVDYIKMFSESYEIVESGDFIIAVTPSSSDEFQFFSWVNDLHFKRGGNQIDFVTGEIVNRLRDKLVKKYKNIKPADIRNKLQVIVMMTNFNNVEVDSQSKETLANSYAEIREYFREVDFDKLYRLLLKNEAIINPIVEIYELKEERDRRALLKKADRKPKKISNEKFYPPVGSWENLIIGEGDSAVGGLMPILGRQGNGFFSMFGVPPSVYDASTQKIAGSPKLKDLKDITGIQYTSRIQDDLRFRNYIIATDQDLPGLRIRGLLLAYFAKFAPELFSIGRVKILKTPIVVVKKKGQKKIFRTFFDLYEYRSWERTVKMRDYDSYYNKGLGSIDKEELQELIEQKGLETFLETIELDSVEPFERWMGRDTDVRKEMLLDTAFDQELQ